MKLAFVGDIHGRVFHMLAVLDYWQRVNHENFAAIFQVGDMGAFPNPDTGMINSKFVQQDPTELDFSRYINADERITLYLRRMRQRLAPIWFIRGNHEDFAWLEAIQRKSGQAISSVDRFDMLHYVADGTVAEVCGWKMAFIGGIDTETVDERSISEVAYRQLLHHPPRDIDILVTHDAPYGVGTGYKGKIQGSEKITRLVETLQPKYLVAGHYHHRIGPLQLDQTIYMGLNILVPPMKKDTLGRVQQGSVCILDTDKGSMEMITGEWLSKFDRTFDFVQYME